MRLVLFAVLIAASAYPADYYVDSAHGDDGKSGTAELAAWKTLGKVNSSRFQPGDRILLKGGSVWQEQLAPSASGIEGAPIVIEQYGKGPKPRIDGAGLMEDAVRLYNVQWIEVRNLEVTNHGDTSAVRRGIHIFLDNFGTARHIVVAGMYIHDVNGTNQHKDNGGIIFRTNGDRTASRFDGLVIERNIVWKVDRSAIVAQSYHWPRRRWFPSLNVVIRDNFVDDIGGDGIVPWATDGAIVEHNIARDCNRRAGAFDAGIWPWSTDNTVLQLNEASFTRGTRDGEGFDSDYNSRNTLFQYNYSHDNEGGFMLICTPGTRSEDNLGNTGTVVRYNISRNDRSRIFHLAGAANATVHNNAIYVGPGLDVAIVLTSDWQGWTSGAEFRDNLFRVEGVARYGHGSRRAEDGTHSIEPGWGGATGIVFKGNRYIGKHINRPSDREAGNNAATPPTMDWIAPQFDPSRPHEFDIFIQKHREWMLGLVTAQFGKPVSLVR